MTDNTMSQPLPKRFQTQVEISRSHITTLRGVILLMAVICGALWYGWTMAPSQMTVHIPPVPLQIFEMDRICLWFGQSYPARLANC